MGDTLHLAVAVLVSLLAALAWMVFFYRYDRGAPEPPARVGLAALFGALSVLPAAAWEAWAGARFPGTSLAGQLVSAFFVVGLGEEAFKFGAAYLAAYRFGRRLVHLPIDAVIYAIAAGLGFAALENVAYAQAFGLAVLPLRAVVGFAVHASFAGISGYMAGLGIARAGAWGWHAARGVAAAGFLHGLYDFAIISRWLSPGGVLAAVALLYILLSSRIVAAQEASA